jgi:hypothetical protein
MKLRVLNFVVAIVALFSVSSAYGWNSAGHCTIGHIADRNLTPKARKMCSKYLGHSLAYYASWLDHWRYSEEYHHTARWHAVGVKDGKLIPGELVGDISIFRAPLTPDEHGVARMEQMLEALKEYRNMPDSAVAVNLKCIIHMVGDMHCPGHVFYDGQKQFEFKENGKDTRFHGYNDKAFLRFHKGKRADEFYKKYCRLTEQERRELCKGDMESWVRDNEPIFRECYTLLSPTIDYKDLPEQNKLRMKEINDQLYIAAGYRLAHVINQIFK